MPEAPSFERKDFFLVVQKTLRVCCENIDEDINPWWPVSTPWNRFLQLTHPLTKYCGLSLASGLRNKTMFDGKNTVVMPNGLHQAIVVVIICYLDQFPYDQ